MTARHIGLQHSSCFGDLVSLGLSPHAARRSRLPMGVELIPTAAAPTSCHFHIMSPAPSVAPPRAFIIVLAASGGHRARYRAAIFRTTIDATTSTLRARRGLPGWLFDRSARGGAALNGSREALRDARPPRDHLGRRRRRRAAMACRSALRRQRLAPGRQARARRSPLHHARGRPTSCRFHNNSRRALGRHDLVITIVGALIHVYAVATWPTSPPTALSAYLTCSSSPCCRSRPDGPVTLFIGLKAWAVSYLLMAWYAAERRAAG